METSEIPRIDLARRHLPAGLLAAITHIFSQGISGAALVGGTALAGFFAAHRRSDDIDLFTKDSLSQAQTIRAAQSLHDKGATFSDEVHSNQYYHTNCLYNEHRFTLDIVLDPNLFRVGKFHKLENGILIADLETILKTKSATLVSRCSEKDLYDLLWFFQRSKFAVQLGYKELIEYGKQIDNGVSGESILLSVSGTELREEACGFVPNLSPKDVVKTLKDFQKMFLKGLSVYLHTKHDHLLSNIVRDLKKILR